VMFGFENLSTQMQRLEQFLIYSDDAHREIETVNLLVARNVPVTFTKPPAAIISELADEMDSAEPEAATVASATDNTTPAAQEPEIRRAKPVLVSSKKTPAVSPGVKKYHSNRKVGSSSERPKPSPMPVRKAIPLQNFKQENNPNG
jgi:hypothetical protein